MSEFPSLSEPSPPSRAPRSRPWWREPEVLLLVLLVAGVHMTRLTDLSARGEETRRGRIGWEMLQTGDWLVPRVQGVPRLSRPPLHYWVIAASGALWGEVDEISVRLPSVAATLLTVLLIYGYGRTFLSRVGAFGAAAGYATMAQVLELGRLGETEAVFTLLMSGSLLVWHWGDCRRWSPGWKWTLGYALAALATLTKGPQGPVYFVGGVTAFLLLQRRGRELLARAHLLGIAVGLALVAAWQIPFTLRLGFDDVSFTYTSEVGKRFGDTHWTTILAHLVTYPLEVFACLMPWSLLLLAFADRAFRGRIGAARAHVVFLLACIAVAFPPVWFPPQSNTRYFMPLYPCFALLVGLVIDRLFAADASARWTRIWPRYVLTLAAVMLAAGVGVCGVSWLAPASVAAQPMSFAILYALLTAVLAGVLIRSRDTASWRRAQLALLAIAVFLGMTYSGVVINVLVRSSEDAAGAVARVRERLPRNVRLVSFGSVSHVFTFHYGAHVPQMKPPVAPRDVPDGVEYFCFDVRKGRVPRFPFAWEEVDRISCERNRKEHPRWEVVVGRRLCAPPDVSRVARGTAEDTIRAAGN